MSPARKMVEYLLTKGDTWYLYLSERSSRWMRRVIAGSGRVRRFRLDMGSFTRAVKGTETSTLIECSGNISSVPFLTTSNSTTFARIQDVSTQTTSSQSRGKRISAVHANEWDAMFDQMFARKVTTLREGTGLLLASRRQAANRIAVVNVSERGSLDIELPKGGDAKYARTK